METADSWSLPPAIPRVPRAAWRRAGLVLALTFGVGLIPARPSAAQDQSGNLWFSRVAVNGMFVLSNNPTLSSASPGTPPVAWIPNISFEVGKRTDGSRDWHHLYGMPSYGFGLSIGSFGDGVATAKPVDAYTFFSWPFARLSKRAQLTTEFGMGLSWNWREFNRETAAYRTVLGSSVNVRVDWGFYLQHQATAQTSVSAGLDFTHRSNGGMRQPNGGINVVGPRVALRYDLSRPKAIPTRTVAAFEPAWELVVGGAAGRKNVIENAAPMIERDYGAFEGTVAVQRHFYRYGKISGGTDLTYDGATGTQFGVIEGDSVRWRPGFGDRFALGLYGGYEHVIDRFSALVHFGYNVARGFDDPSCPQFYVRYGWRYHVSDRVWGQFSIRSIEGYRADFIEFGAGYRMYWRRGSS